MADLTSEFYYNPKLKATVRYILTGEYLIKPNRMEVYFIREIWSSDLTTKQAQEKKHYVDNKHKRNQWQETLLVNLVSQGFDTMGDVFFNSCLNAVLIKEGVSEEHKIILNPEIIEDEQPTD